MGFSLKKGFKAIGKDLSNLAKSSASKIKKYQEEAPERRKKQIQKLKDDIEIQKLKAQKRKHQGERRLLIGAGGSIGEPEIGRDIPNRRKRYGPF